MSETLGLVIAALFICWMVAVVVNLSRIANNTAAIANQFSRDNTHWSGDYSKWREPVGDKVSVIEDVIEPDGEGRV